LKIEASKELELIKKAKQAEMYAEQVREKGKMKIEHS
jgi:hypothetical protein